VARHRTVAAFSSSPAPGPGAGPATAGAAAGAPSADLGLPPAGWPGWAIAQQLGIGKNTVFATSDGDLAPRVSAVQTAAAVSSRPTPPISWSAGTRGVVTPCACFRELQPRGYPGATPRSPATPASAPGARGGTPTAATAPPSATRDRAAAPLLDPAPGDLARPATAGAAHAEEEHLLAQLTVQDATLADAIALAQDFAQLVRQAAASTAGPMASPGGGESLGPPAAVLRTGCETTMTRSKLA